MRNLFLALVAGVFLFPAAGVARNNRDRKNSFYKGSRVLFAFDADEVRDAGSGELDGVADFLRRHPNATLVLEGHADRSGPGEYNLDLGDRRARAVKGYLVAAGVAAERLVVLTRGETKPAGDAAASRRVEIRDVAD